MFLLGFEYYNLSVYLRVFSFCVFIIFILASSSSSFFFFSFPQIINRKINKKSNNKQQHHNQDRSVVEITSCSIVGVGELEALIIHGVVEIFGVNGILYEGVGIRVVIGVGFGEV